MSRLDELIAELCPDGVEYKKIDSICGVYDGTHQTPKYTSSGIKFVSVENITDPFGTNKYISEEEFGSYKVKPQMGDVLMTRIGTIGVCTVLDHDEPLAYYVSLALLRPKRNYLDSKFLKYAIESLHGRKELRKWTLVNAVPIKINTGDIGRITIPVPPLPVQQEIVRILDHFTELTAELQKQLDAELTARKKQYEYYANTLLCFPNAPYYALAELCDIVDYRGKTPKKSDEGVFLVTAKNIRQGYIDYEKSKEYIPVEIYDDVMHRGLPQIGDVLITTEAPCGYVAQVDRIDIALAQRVIKYRPKTDALDSSFLKYILLGSEFQEKLQSAATGGTVKGIKGSTLHRLTIPVPSIDVQHRVVDNMNKFNELCTHLTSGLPVEIAARQKQYEYYRDKLLAFRRISI